MSRATLVNDVDVPAAREAEFPRLWAEADALLRPRGRNLTTRLHQEGRRDSYRYLHVAALDSVGSLRDVVTSPACATIARRMADVHAAPGVITVAGEQRPPTATAVR